MKLNKSLLSNVAAAIVTGAGLALDDPWRDYVLNTGLFALSGGITNWLAIHMLFERVPGFYGSGVIPLRFEEFKLAIRKLIMEQFFNRENLDRFFQSATEIADRLERELAIAVERLDLDNLFDALVASILDSRLGSMLGMFGGRGALDGLRQPFMEKVRDYLGGLFSRDSFRAHLQEAVRNSVESDAVLHKLEAMIDARLAQMTPALVKQIVQDMIREHLGWLVIWGTVVGGALGLVTTAIGQWVL